jgi:phosphoadenosine phosphosulfate reductase
MQPFLCYNTRMSFPGAPRSCASFVRVTDRDLGSLNERFREAPPSDVLRFVVESFGDRAAILSSMQRSDAALCHLADGARHRLDVLFVDTGVLHQQTLETRDRLAAACANLHVVTLRPERSFADQTAELGVLYLSKEGQEQCCELRKTAPLLALRGRYDALLSALRRSEGGARANLQVFSIDPAMNALRVHPFAWLGHGLDAYLAEHPDVIVNPLHAMGFPSIGCFPCTTPVLPDEPERAGRWRHLASVQYCGINPVDRAGGPASIELPQRYASLFA